MSRMLAFVLVFVPAISQAQQEGWPRDLVEWTPRAENPVFQGEGGAAWDKKIRERGWIAVEEGVFHLWYTGYNDEVSPLRRLGHATSADGLRWRRDPDNPLVRDEWVEDVNVVRRNGQLLMFAEGTNDQAHALASTDGRRWTETGRLDVRLRDGSPVPPGPYGTPTVWVEGETWHLFYERRDEGIWLATSKDRRVWTNVRDEPVLARGPSTYDRTAVALNQIIKRDGWYYGLYHANAERPWKEWTTCLARSRDLVHWEKYPGNPIVRDNASSGQFVEVGGRLRLYTMHPEVRAYENPVPSPQRR